MNFFAQQDAAKRQTRRMLLLVALAVFGVVVATDLVLLLAFAGDGATPSLGGMLGLSLVVGGTICLGSLYRIATLRGGGAAVARGLGATPVPVDTTDFTYRRLRNVIEEIAIASGVPVPELFVLEEEAGINAFAAGYTPADAAVTVTRGALDKLTRAELQGVIGHEFSHVLNGDMRLNIRLMGVVFGILVLATIGRRIANLSARSRIRDSGGVVMLGLAVFAIGYIGVVLARVIRAAISRQREYLADASAVQFTRHTEGIAGALKKIGALSESSTLENTAREEVSHMFFADGLGFSAVFATHPPLEDRIRRLDPTFLPDELTSIRAAWQQPLASFDDRDGAEISIAGFAPAGPVAVVAAEPTAGVPAAGSEVRLAPMVVARQVGNPGTDDQLAARGLRDAIPAQLREAATRRETAMALVFALLLDVDAAMRERQLATIAAHCDAGSAALAAQLAAETAKLHPMLRLPLAALAFPALRRRPRPQLTTFMIVLRALIDADQHVTLGEYCLGTLIRVQVIDALHPAKAALAGRLKLPQVASELADLLALLAQHGHADDPAAARRAFALGMQEVLPRASVEYRPPGEWIFALDHALQQLDRLSPAGKQLVVQALVRAISADGMVMLEEAELLRTICAALHCPLPPLLQEA